MSALSISSSKSRFSGFTLIELLAVIAIIGILASVIFMAVRSGIVKAQKSECASHLRTIGQAFNMFVAENKGEYPRASTSDDNGNPNWTYEGGFWFNALGPYLNGNAFQQALVSTGPHPQQIPFACPAVSATEHGWGGAGIDVAINAYILPSGKRTVQRVRAANIKNPTSTFLVVDCSTNWAIYIPDGNTPPMPAFQFPHSDQANVLFFDGHVSSVSRGELQTNPALIAKLRGEK